MKNWLISFTIFIFCLVINLVIFYHPTVKAAGNLIAYWKFDDGSGTAPVDSSGNNITGSFLTPNPSWSTDTPSEITFDDPYSLDFTGNGDGVSISWPAERNFADTDPRSFSFWYKPTADGEGGGTSARILSWSNDRFEIAGTFGSSSTHKIAYYDGNWHETDITLTLGTWYFVTFTYDGTTAKFYIGDDLQDEHSLAGRALSGTMMIGNRAQNPNEGINGFIDDFRVYNYALTQNQVTNLSTGTSEPDGNPSPSPSPVSQTGLTAASGENPPPGCTSSAPNGKPDLFQIDPAGTYANLYFKTVSGTSGYNINYGLTPEANQHGDHFDYSGSEWTLGRTISQLKPNTTYYFRVQAVNGCNASSWSETKQIKTQSAWSNVTSWFANLNPFKSKPVATFVTTTAKTNAGSQQSSSPQVAGVASSNRKTPASCLYTFQKGDSLWSIAQTQLGRWAYKEDILALNPGLDPQNMRLNQQIKLCE